jgi:hypothetical protein
MFKWHLRSVAGPLLQRYPGAYTHQGQARIDCLDRLDPFRMVEALRKAVFRG